MKIVFLLLNLSDLDKPSGMYSDLITEFIRNGHEVFPVAVQIKDKRSGISVESGITVIRVKTLPLFNIHPIFKGIANILLPMQYSLAISRYFRNTCPDLVILPTPPVTLAGLLGRLKKKFNAKTYLILRDIFPQNAVDLRMIRKPGLLYKYFRSQEIKLYDSSDFIGCMSEGNINYIQVHNPDMQGKKLHILMNFQRIPEFDPEKGRKILESWGIANKFLVVFGGNIGLPQKVSNIIELARRCEVYHEVVFLFIGDGTHSKTIEGLSSRKEKSNIVFKKSLPRDDYENILKNCHIGLISLNESYTIPNFPSKTVSYFAAGLPVLASIDKSTDYGSILKNSCTGLVSEAGDHDSLFLNFKTLYESSELRQMMGSNGEAFFKQNMTINKAYNTILDNVSKAI